MTRRVVLFVVGGVLLVIGVLAAIAGGAKPSDPDVDRY